MRLLLLIAFVVACSKEKSEPLPSLPLESFAPRRAELVERLKTNHLENGYIVSRNSDGSPEHQGDSLLWSGLWLGIADCDEARPTFEAIARSVENRLGEFVRFEPLPLEYDENRTSRDQLLGAMFGLVRRAKKCAEDADRIAAIWRLHHDLVEAIGSLTQHGKPSRTSLTPAFRFVWQDVARFFQLSTKPDDVSFVFEASVLIDARRIVSMRDSCFPLHLSLLEMLILSETGNGISRDFKSRFCDATTEAGLPLLDWYCERDGFSVEFYLKSFQLNQFEYAHQRCPAWETPDGRADLETPAMDWLVIYHLAREGIQ